MTLVLHTLFLIVLLFHGYQSIAWTSGPQNGATLYACVGDDVIIPWTYTLGTGDVLHDIQWLYQGQSQEVIALFSHGTFVPLPAFANRVQRVANGGLQISHVTMSDTGNYTVEITVADPSSNQFILKKQLVLEIADDLMTSHHQLYVSMNPMPVLDNTTNTFSIELQCGHFLFDQSPPFDVQWLTPSGSIYGSSQFKGGRFFYLLPPQAKGGNYTCLVSAHAAGTCVARDMEASVVVDAMDIRLALMEARLTAADTARTQLISDQKELQGQLNATTAELTAGNIERRQLQGQLNATTAKLTAVDIERTQLEARLTAADTERKQLQDQLNATTMELAAFKQRNRLVVSFHAGGLTKYSYGARDHLILATVFTNQGNGYNNNTGIFTAPVSGTYCFIASTGATVSSHWAGFYIMQGGSLVGYAYVYDGDYPEMATGHAVLHLVAGDTVWLKAIETGEYWSGATWFSGVLISPDP